MTAPDKSEILLTIFQAQQRVLPLMTAADARKNAGDLPGAVESYEALVAALGSMLDAAELNNSTYPDTPFEIGSIVNPTVDALLTEADVVEMQGDPVRGEELRRRGMDLAVRYLTEDEVAERRRQLASSLLASGRFVEALTALSDARDLFERHADTLRLASVTSDLAGVREWLGDYARAVADVQRAFGITGSVDHGRPDVAAALATGQWQQVTDGVKLEQITLNLEQILARAARHRGDLDEAERRFLGVLQRVPGAVRPAIEFHLAVILVERGRLVQALAEFERLGAVFQGLLRPKLSAILSWRGEALLRLGRAGEAVDALQRTEDELRTYRDPDSLWKCQWRKGRALAALDRKREALDAMAASAATVNELRKAPLGYRLDSTYLADKLPAFSDGISLAAKLKDARTCCNLIELVKSRILAAALSVPSVDATATENPLDARLDAISRELDGLEYSGSQDAWTDAMEARRTALRQERADLLERRRFSDPRWRSLSEPVPFDPGTVLDALAARRQAAITLFRQPSSIVSVLLAGGRCEVLSLPLSDAASRAIEAYTRNLQADPCDPALFDPSSSLGLDAGQLVPGALLDGALQADSLVIVPHGDLHLLPWASLSFGGRRLFERCPVGILPNLTSVLALGAPGTTPRVALIGAPDYKKEKPLPLAAEEIEVVREIYAPRDAVIGVRTGKLATEGAFWELARDPTAAGAILHVACHGDFIAGDPMGSGLLLMDGRVDASEIARSRLQYDEVVLSACSSGRRATRADGVDLTGDEIVGVPGAFLEAGVKSVLVSIPPAEDAVAMEVNTRYHEHRARGTSPLPALREVQSALLKEGRYPPYLWAGFTIYGC